MYLVTHGELTPGYQIAQVAHAVAELAISHPDHFQRWHSVSQYIIALQTHDAESLAVLFNEAKNLGMLVKAFYEPDLGNEMTALAFVPSDENVKFLSQLPLAGKKTGVRDKSFSQ